LFGHQIQEAGQRYLSPACLIFSPVSPLSAAVLMVLNRDFGLFRDNMESLNLSQRALHRRAYDFSRIGCEQGIGNIV
jgi:hypothetical protein